MTHEFRVEWRDDDGSRLVSVSGEVDLTSASDLRDALESGLPRLVVDLSNVTFIDMSGLRCLVDAAGVHEAVALITSPRVARLLDLTATAHLFEIAQAFEGVQGREQKS